MNLMYYLIGNNSSYYKQFYLSLYSFLQFGEIEKVTIYTDNPSYLKAAGDIAEIIPLSPATVKDWLGKYNYGWRAKTKAIEDLASRTDELFIYLDTDTFLHSPLQEMADNLKKGIAYMHLKEGELSSMRHKELLMWKKIKGKTYGGIKIDKGMPMWNAGVVAMPVEKRLETVRHAITLIDDFCSDGVQYHVTEQYSLSLALSKVYPMAHASDYVRHYWPNKPDWDKLSNDFLLKTLYEKCDLNDAVKMVKELDVSKLPYSRHEPGMKARLKKLLDKLLPDRLSFIDDPSLKSGPTE